MTIIGAICLFGILILFVAMPSLIAFDKSEEVEEERKSPFMCIYKCPNCGSQGYFSMAKNSKSFYQLGGRFYDCPNCKRMLFESDLKYVEKYRWGKPHPYLPKNNKYKP